MGIVWEETNQFSTRWALSGRRPINERLEISLLLSQLLLTFSCVVVRKKLGTFFTPVYFRPFFYDPYA